MKLLKKIIFPIIIVIIIYAIFLFLTDIDKIADKIINFKLEFVPIIIALVVSSWIIVYSFQNKIRVLIYKGTYYKKSTT